MQVPAQGANGQAMLDAGDLGSGAYLVRIEVEGETFGQRLVIQR